jgi:hypothetical protein
MVDNDRKGHYSLRGGIFHGDYSNKICNRKQTTSGERILKKALNAKEGGEKKQDYHGKYVTIKSLAAPYSVSLLCKIAGVSRSGYYKWLERKQCPSAKQLEDQVLKDKLWMVTVV